MEDGALKGKVGVQQTADQNSDEQGGIDLLGDQGQRNGDDGGKQRPGRIVEVAGGLHKSASLAGGTLTGTAAVLAGVVVSVTGHTQAGAAAVGALDPFAAGLLGGIPLGVDGGGHGSDQDQKHRQQRQQSPQCLFHSTLS